MRPKNQTQMLSPSVLRLPAVAAAFLFAATPGASDSSIAEKVAPPSQENATKPPEDANKPLPKPKDGVIRPPANVDPEMTVKPPDNNTTMPVIPPPGSPGGDPSVKPK
jgi:hypothetical protein